MQRSMLDARAGYPAKLRSLSTYELT